MDLIDREQAMATMKLSYTLKLESQRVSKQIRHAAQAELEHLLRDFDERSLPYAVILAEFYLQFCPSKANEKLVEAAMAKVDSDTITRLRALYVDFNLSGPYKQIAKSLKKEETVDTLGWLYG